jgi:lipoprotein-anchoring transpeptidase ErfK/SrfK
MHLGNIVKAGLLALCLIGVGAVTASAGVVININKTTQQMTVAVDGVKRYTWKVSTGKFGYWTPSGTFKPFRMEPDHFSEEWDDAPMPHSIFFTAEGHAIHGSPYTRRLGSAVSHGCVRLAPGNARTLYSLVARKGMANTRIIVSGPGDAFAQGFAPIGKNVKKAVPRVKRQFGDWLQETGR